MTTYLKMGLVGLENWNRGIGKSSKLDCFDIVVLYWNDFVEDFVAL